MDKGKWSKALALILSVLMVLCCLGGCGNSKVNEVESETTNVGNKSEDGVNQDTSAQTSSEPKELTLPLTEEKKELTVWMVYTGNEISDLNEIKGIQKMEEMTNVHINWIPISLLEVQEKFGILIGGGDLPDIIYPASYSYPGGAQKGIDDGVLLDMDEYVRSYMPNYMYLLSQNEVARKQATSDDGKLHSLKVIVGSDLTVEDEGNYQGMAYRKDLLDAMGIELPTTIEGWHGVLVQCKDSGMETPLCLIKNGGSSLSMAWGVYSQGPGYYLQLDGTQVIYGPAQEGFGGYLDTMRQWFSEGLVNPNFTSSNRLLQYEFSILQDDQTMLMDALSGQTGTLASDLGFISNDKVYLQPILCPALNEGDSVSKWARNIVAKDNIYVTTSCKDPVLAAKWLDFQYSQEGQYLNWYGIEGETYELGGDDNTPQFTELVLNNPDGLTAKSVLEQYAINQCSWLGKHDYSMSLKLTEATSVNGTMQQDAVELWSSPDDNVALTEGLMLTEDEGDTANTLITALSTLVEERMVNYILGKDNMSHGDFTQKLYDNGLQEVLDIYQAAYERYLER